jgi:uncharacterized protein (TIRG00374 family)
MPRNTYVDNLPLNREQDAPVSIVRRIFSLPTVVSLALAAAFLFFIAVRLDIDLNAIGRQLRSANVPYLALAVAVHYTTFLFRGLRWRLLLNNARADGEESAGIFQCSQLVLLGWFANSVVWMRLGDAYRAYLYRQECCAPFVRTVGTILTERLLDIATIVMLLAVSLPFLVRAEQGGAWTVAATAAALLGILTLVLLFIAATRERGEGVLRCLVSWLPVRMSGWLLERYHQFRDGALLSLRLVPLAAVWGLLGWLAEVARFYLVAQALDIHLSPALVVFATVANSLLTLAPTPGGVGAVEAGLAGLLKQLSTLATPTVAALVLVDRAISYLSVIAVGGALFLARWATKRKNRKAQTDTPATHNEGA